MKTTKKLLSAFFLLTICASLLGISQPVHAEDESIIEVFSPYYTEIHTTLQDGTPITRSIINGPRQPLPEFEEERLASLRSIDGIEGLIPNFPSYSWVFGCSAVSQAMISAYHDRTGAPNLYTGPTEGGVAPITDTSWPKWTDGAGDEYPSNPIIASRMGVDGRSIKGSIEDYWVQVDSTAQDPYITGGWAEHNTFEQAVGDYMFTSQSKYDNTDGSTVFYNYNDNKRLSCDLMQSENLKDGTLGRKNYYNYRGYTVTDCYNQRVDSQVAGGYTLAQYQAEIDAGQPVLLNLKGHSVVGYGYDGNTIFIRDTWNSDPNFRPTFQWGGSYDGMELQSVSIVKLVKGSTPPPKALNSFPMVFTKNFTPPPPPQPIKNGDFEAGKVDWIEYSLKGFTLIGIDLPNDLKPTSGTYAVWLGGSNDETSRISQTFTIPTAYKDLAFNYHFYSEDTCGKDFFYVKINDNVIDTKDSCAPNNSTAWGTLTYSLAAYQGQTIQLTLESTTDGEKISNVLIDDVRMILAETLVGGESNPPIFEALPPGDYATPKFLPN